jgi:GGDEF domain-containing protein
LATRKRLLDALRAEMDQTRNEVPFALLLVELANLPVLVQARGAQIKERALVLAAAQLRSAAREGHVVARVDDAVFAILAQRPKGPADANALATQIVAQGLRPSPLVPGHEVLRFHVVVGVLPWHDLDAEGVLRILSQELAQIGADARKTIRTVRADGS